MSHRLHLAMRLPVLHAFVALPNGGWEAFHVLSRSRPSKVAAVLCVSHLARSGVMVALAGLFVTLVAGCAHVHGNFRPVDHGVYYRSGQMSPALLDSRLRRHGIKTVVNLRGADPGTHWYVNETALCEKRGVAHHSLEWTMKQPPAPESLHAFLKILQEAEKPVLVHCHGGVHRAAVAAACYRLMQGDSVAAAQGELGFFFNGAPIGQLLELYGASGGPFEQWAVEEYPAQYTALGLLGACAAAD